MDSIISIFAALWHQDALALQHANLLLLYFCLGLLIFLESGFLPAAPLPCDSVIVLSGSLAAAGVLQLHWVLLTLFLAGWLGSLIAFYQGHQLKHWRIINRWLNKVPVKQLVATDKLMSRYGLVALFFGRFFPVVRSLLPMIMGLRNSVKPLKFFSASAISSLFWVAFLVSTGYGISLLPTRLEQLATQILMIAPVFTLMMALLTLLTSTILKKRARKLKVLVKD
ncbi:DedA family protein [Vibrio mimicus]|uniref:DedA family protein n=1 Tax=Vibrio mimicus TaxID=674 RepID=UPI0002BA3177|nr:DedA family protein [Vibrio mimicus]EMB49988.1 DedA protein [Vibrio mimicus CAIM 602]MBY7676084.1 DedA family protein [Vibrio mimicus]MBY7727942.1 DedA family protein [Vibrio mimicus]TXX99496.1 DedA family protein [Vibrio mimicus]TXY27038.1 DedA family protein [Vibrio mimicus]